MTSTLAALEWYPTILGVLVVIAALTLFVGSIWLLLGTNLGARLGFLVLFTTFMGFIMVLSLLWLTTASPLESPKGRVASWSVIENVNDLGKAKTEAVRGINNEQHRASEIDASNVAAAVDAALITKVSTPTVQYTPNDNRFAKFDAITDFQILQTWTVGGSNPQLWKGEVNHQTKYAVIQYCKNAEVTQTFGLPPLPPQCASSARGYIVAQYDYGTLRLPPFFVLVISAILFGLGLLMLHWREKDELEAAEAAKRESARPAAVRDQDSELTKV